MRGPPKVGVLCGSAVAFGDPTGHAVRYDVPTEGIVISLRPLLDLRYLVHLLILPPNIYFALFPGS